jgi:hydrogenase expression/formation protein HypE
MHRLISEVFVRHFGNPMLRRLEDAAEFEVTPRRRVGVSPRIRLALTTDSYVVQPLFFPGGDIGKLAVCGTVNDLAVKGATPRYLSAGFIISTGFPIEQLDRICRSMARTARRAGVEIITGDTKVIEAGVRGQGAVELAEPGLQIADCRLQIAESKSKDAEKTQKGRRRDAESDFCERSDSAVSASAAILHLPEPPNPELLINTSGVGTLEHNLRFGPENIRAGDKVLISGTIGDHEAAIVLARGEFDFHAQLKSDCAPLNGLIARLIDIGRIRMMRDPTRGGVATTLNEIADAAGLGIILDEKALPIRPAVRGVCELLGLEPPYLANEGKVLCVAARADAGKVLKAMRGHALGRDGAIVGEVTREYRGVWLRTALGSLRPLLMLEGQQLPRIC